MKILSGSVATARVKSSGDAGAFAGRHIRFTRKKRTLVPLMTCPVLSDGNRFTAVRARQTFDI